MSINIMEHIWSGTLEVREEPELSALARVFHSLLATPMICFTFGSTSNTTEPFAFFSGDQVLLGASLADVLYEEFEIEVTDETIVLFEPASQPMGRKQNNEELGLALGNVLVDLASSSHFESPAQIAKAKLFLEPQMTKRRMQAELIQ